LDVAFGLLGLTDCLLSDEQIAGVLTYIRREWDHEATPVPVDLVKKIRQENKGRTDAWTEPELLGKK